MSKVRVYEVARQLGMKNKELVALFQSLGFNEVRNHMSAVEQDVVDKVKRKLERKDEPEVVEQRIRKGVVKRRARGRKVVTPSGAGAAPSNEGAVPEAKPSVPEAEPSAPKKKAPTEAEAPKKTPAKVEEPPKNDTTPEPAEKVAAKEAEPAAKEPEAPADEAAEPEDKPEAEAKPEKNEESKPEPMKAEPADKADAKKAEPAAAKAEDKPEEPKKRPTSPPKTGIEVWGGRPGVPMPQRPRTGQRRTTYDPRANAGGGGRFGRPGGRPGYRPGFRRSYHQRNQRKGPVHVSTKEMSDEKKVIKIEGETTVQRLAHEMSMKATELLMKLPGMGMSGVNINSSLDVDTAKLVGEEFGWTIEDVAIDVEEELAAATEMDEGDVGEAIIRPAIVTVMGHVDHGKTTLLDTIRKTNVAGGEAGGITQHIGAYRVETATGTLCFLDTPGHEAFTSMRARGASVTDIVILIVAADDGVMPQTKEAIAHSRDAGVPIIVAVNKCDKPGVDPERVMRDLASEGLQPEEWGGDTIFCKVSALKGDGIDNLLEMVALQAEVLELEAHPDKRASGVVVEALLDRGRGPVARVLVQDGTLARGDVLLAGSAYGKVRAMVDEKGDQVDQAGPSTPVEVLGLNAVPDAGDMVYGVVDMKAAETLADERKKKQRKATDAQAARVSLEALTNRLQEGEQLELKVIVKADVQGSVEALQQALSKLSTKKVKLSIVHTAVGGITETDVNLAVAAQAIIIGFNVRPAGKARKFAEQEGVEIRLYNVIYEAIDDVRSAMEGLLPAKKVEKELGRAEVRQIFRISKVGTIAGCMVVQGIIKRNAHARLVREDVVVWEGMLASLKRFKDDAKEVREGFECGMSLDGYNDLKEGDFIEAYEFEEVKATLD
ncbi:MAG TPA: translation initiation factor IF-2 [Polyangiaceae bacterium]|nr:translation initiation factor IF-2 [Polyangiaceae bacterium]